MERVGVDVVFSRRLSFSLVASSGCFCLFKYESNNTNSLDSTLTLSHP